MNILATTTPTTSISSNWPSLSTILTSTEQSNLYSMTQPFSKANLIYRATRDGFQGSAFHSRCDNITNTVTVIRNNFNYVFGGFTAAKWSSPVRGEWIVDSIAFIFSLRRNGTSNIYKLPIQSTVLSYAILGVPGYGPIYLVVALIFL